MAELIINKHDGTMKQYILDEMQKSSRLDILTGYLRDTGIELLEDGIENINKVRVIVGVTEEDSNILSNFYTRSVRKSFLLNCLRTGKLEVRGIVGMHSKNYTFTYKNGGGNVLVGSANLTYSGIEKNYEQGMADQNVYEESKTEFEELWGRAFKINLGGLGKCEKELDGDDYKVITPYDLFIKVLYDIYGDQSGLDIDEEKLPENFKLVRYQEDAVNMLKNIINKHNGGFLCDVVGLGKTYTCALLMREFSGKKLVLCPPEVISTWVAVMRGFKVKDVDVVSHGMLSSLTELEEAEDKVVYKYKGKYYSLVVVDEAHNFRNVKTQGYRRLHKIIKSNIEKGSKAVLVTATPLNNNPKELKDMIGLFHNIKCRSSILEGENAGLSINKFMGPLIKRYNKAIKTNDKQVIDWGIRECGKVLRDAIVSKVTIRRTRKDIMEYYEDDMLKHNWKFPIVNEPISIKYDISKMRERILDSTADFIDELHFARYKLQDYVKEGVFDDTHNFLHHIIKITLMKRMDSSITAFVVSLNKMIEKYEQTVIDYQNGFVRKVVQNMDDDGDVINMDNTFIFLSDIKSPETFISHIESDLKVLRGIKEVWQGAEDVKYSEFLNTVRGMDFNDGKLVIFTQYKDTLNMLYDRLKNDKYRVIKYYSNKGKKARELVKRNFDAVYEYQENSYDILVTTEVLSEGINLHRANKVVNYDIPWNPIKVTQRVGRLNRVGAIYDGIFVYNFFPTEGVDKIIKSEKNILSKLRMVFRLYGEDDDLLGTDFDFVDIETIEDELRKSIKALNEERNEEVNDDVYFRNILYMYKLYNMGKLLWLKNLSGKLICSKNEDFNFDGSLFYVNKKGNNGFYLVNDGKVVSLDTFEALRLLECGKSRLYNSRINKDKLKVLLDLIIEKKRVLEGRVTYNEDMGFDTGGVITGYLKKLFKEYGRDGRIKRIIKNIRGSVYKVGYGLEKEMYEAVKDKKGVGDFIALFDRVGEVESKLGYLEDDSVNLICGLI